MQATLGTDFGPLLLLGLGLAATPATILVGPVPFDNLHGAAAEDKHIVLEQPVDLPEVREVHPFGQGVIGQLHRMAGHSIVPAHIVPSDGRHPQRFNTLATRDTQRILPHLHQQTISMKGEPPSWSRLVPGRSDLREKRFPHAKQWQPVWV